MLTIENVIKQKVIYATISIEIWDIFHPDDLDGNFDSIKTTSDIIYSPIITIPMTLKAYPN